VPDVKWWDEEFWATTAITFASVAVTIGITVWISWWILNHQLRHERESQARQREEQLADLRAEVARERRIRQAVGLPDVLALLQSRIGGVEVNLYNNRHMWSFWAGKITESYGELDNHEVRLANDALMFGTVTELRELSRLWIDAANGADPTDAEWWEKWRAASVLLQQDILQLRERIPHWEDTGEVTLPGLPGTRRLIESLKTEVPSA
jgi:hypothetical protein